MAAGQTTANTAEVVTLDLSKTPVGVYILNVTTADGRLSRKLLKVE